MMCSIDTCSSCCCCLHWHSIFSRLYQIITKNYLWRIGLRLVFSSTFFPQWPLRKELIWFWPILTEETSPKSNSKSASWHHFTNMGIRVLSKSFPPQQLSIVSHARLLLSMINCSYGFFAFRSLKNWRNLLPGLLCRSWPHVESLTELRQGLKVPLRPKKQFLFCFGFQNYVNLTLTDPRFKCWI